MQLYATEVVTQHWSDRIVAGLPKYATPTELIHWEERVRFTLYRRFLSFCDFTLLTLKSGCMKTVKYVWVVTNCSSVKEAAFTVKVMCSFRAEGFNGKPPKFLTIADLVLLSTVPICESSS